MDATTQTILIVICIVCLILSGYFSATETVFTTLNKLRIKTKADDGNKRAKLVLRLVDGYDKLLSTILIGNNIVNITLSSIGTLLFIEWLKGDQSLGSTISTVVITVVVLIFGEITPKTLAKEFPEKFAFFSAPIINAIMLIFTPFTFIFGLWKKLLSKVFKNKEEAVITDEELITLVDEAEQEGGLNAQESELIKSAIEFNDLEVRDILIPRIDVVAVEDTATSELLSSLFTETGYSRFPVYNSTIDNVVGVIHEKDFIKHKDDEEFNLISLIKPAVFVVETTKISAVLQQLQKAKSHMAIVSGEFGDTVGIITMEDILEELVGEIWDEHDEVSSDVVEISENEYKVNGSTSVNYFEDIFDLELDSDSTTVGGWVIDLLGKVPSEGDRVSFENLEIEVTKTDFRRIVELKIIKTIKDEEE
ncbi:MAG: HlyC/CorC family transporter [Clostridia bacterium]|nr:HlyC/CorC family transporter [Clostridia bacterium]